MRSSTNAQVERQLCRSYRNGQYIKYHRCEICGNKTGNNYYSLPDCNETGFGVVICKQCARKYQ